jgi:Fe-S oxidoreductase
MGLISWVKGLGGSTLYYPGCLTKGVLTEEFGRYKEIFNLLGVDFVMLPEGESCCGLPVLNAGYKKDARKLAEKNFEVFKKYGIRKIITNCPSCYHTFKEIYPKLLRDWNIEVEHATVTILNGLKRKGIRLRATDGADLVAYHDPCHLGRYSGIYEEPREVIELLGGKLVEYPLNRENAFCCGGGGGVRANFPDTAKKIAELKDKYAPKGAKKIISPCGLCYMNIKSATDRSMEFSAFVLGKLRGLG